jgi:dihydrofolate reductase
MRKLIFAINMTLDGCCDHTKGLPDEELLDHYTHLLRDIDLIVYGRKTYEIMIPYWPEVLKNPSETRAEIEFAKAFCAISKIVFSRTLSGVEDKNTRVVGTDLQGEILRLKQQQGKSIWVGGVDIPSQLIELGLVDEFRIVVQPLFGGEGRRLLEGVSLLEKRKLKLIESKRLESGSVALHYSK